MAPCCQGTLLGQDLCLPSLPKTAFAEWKSEFLSKPAFLDAYDLMNRLAHHWSTENARHSKIGGLLQVGASNELPESEELDALYDRFLLRKEVTQVSTAALKTLLAETAAHWKSQLPRWAADADPTIRD